MNLNKLFLLLIILGAQFLSAQVKIGQNPNTINSASIVELESTDKAFVLTRVSTIQMQAITPLRGAVVYNTDTQCLHFFDSLQWVNLCSATNSTGFSFTDNNDGTITLSDGNGSDLTFNGAPETNSTLVDNLDGTYTYTNESGLETNIINTPNVPQNLNTDGTSGNISIDGGNTISLNVNDADADAGNEIQDLQFSGGIISLTNDPDATLIDLSGYNDSAAIAAVQLDINTNESDADTAIAAVQTDVDTNEADADAAIALKEDTANKSTDVALGTSDDAFPTQNAVKTYVDNQVGTITTDDDITGVSFDGLTNEITVEEGTTSFSTDLSALEESADIAAVQTDVDNNETTANNAIAAVQTDVDTNEADADAAIALKEDTANKSTDIALGTSDDAFPTQNAVKTYVDNQVGTITTDDDITGVSFDGLTNEITVEEGTTSFSADLSALEESADIAAVQTDVDNNETTANNAIAAVQLDVDNNETSANNAIAAVQTDVDTNETAANNAIALKEDTANKSTNVALGTSDDAFPTQNAVKTYVDNQVGTITTDDDITGVSFDGLSNEITVEEGTTSFSVDLSVLEESADIAAVQTDVDNNETAANNAIAAVQTDVDNNETSANNAIALKEDTANKSTDVALGTSNDAFPTQNAVKTYVDNQVGTITTDDDITGVSFDGLSNEITVEEGTTSFSADLSALEESADIAAVQLDVNTNEADSDAAIALKEDTANKSTDVALGTSDDAFPTQNAVKTYVDNQVGTITTDDDITGVSFDGLSNEITVEEGTTSFSADLSALEESADIAAVQTDVDNNETAANNAIAAVQLDVDTNEADADTAIALKEDTANKSTNVALGTSDDAFPTQNAVKTYVDNQVGTITTDDDITGVSFDGLSNEITVEEGTTSFSADLSALEESADIAAVQTDVDNNETAANNAIAAVQTDVDNNETAANNAITAVQTDVDNNETAANNAIATVQTDVDTNEADADAAIALKEDSANKSTNVALGTSDDAFPTQNAVKTYVDNQVGTITTDDDITGVSFDGTSNEITVEEGTTSFSADLSALEESADIAAVQTDVDNNETAANNAIAAVQLDVDNNETAANNAIAAVQLDVDTNEVDADAAIALKEDSSNKSTDVALGTSDDAFPTQNAVKTYVDTQVGTIATDDDITGVSFDGTSNEITVEEGTTSFSADLSALEESTDIAAVQTDVDNNETAANNAIAAVQLDVDNNETAANNAIAAVQLDVNTNEADADAAIALKEDSSNKSTDVALGTSDDAFPTQNAVKTYVDTQVGTIATDDDITGVSFDGLSNEITVEEGTTSFSTDLSTLEESADIAAVQADVDNNETSANNAIAAVQTDVDNNETSASNAIAAVQTDVDTNEADADAAIALKEDTANKSTNVALGTSDDAFPTQNAVKTYVDNQVGTITTDDDITGVSFDGLTNEITVEEGTTSFSADLSALEESADIEAVQTDVDNNETAANNAIAAVQLDVDNNETSTNNAIGAVQLDVDNNEAAANNAIAAVQLDVDTNEADADAAIALKEDTANKSTDVALGTSDDAFPTQNAVKTYVDNQVGTITTDDDITGVSFNGLTNEITVEEGTTSFFTDLSALEESADIAAVQTDVDNNETAVNNAIAAVQTDVDNNETAANNAITAVQTDVDNNETAANNAIALKEDTANKSTDVALGTSDDAFPTQNAVKTYVDDLPRVYVGTFRITAAGTSTITGIPFTPSSITFTAYANVEDFNMDTDNGVGNNNSGLANAYGNMRGFARNDGGTITEQVIYIGGSGNSINDISRYASSSHAIGLRYSNQNGDKLGITSATVTSFNANGFTINTDSYVDGIVVIFEAYR